MSEISQILDCLRGTREETILNKMEETYNHISDVQNQWYSKSQFNCVEGCGECCKNFEPDLLESEALYLAAWLLQNQNDVAQKIAQRIFPLPRDKGCQFWNKESNYHCTVYGGRPLICRLFGASGFYDKNSQVVFSPCKFYPAEKLSKLRFLYSINSIIKKKLKLYLVYCLL